MPSTLAAPLPGPVAGFISSARVGRLATADAGDSGAAARNPWMKVVALPARAAANDQSRVATPGEATRTGANFLVVGRPITAAADPRRAAQDIAEEIASASRRAR